MELCQILVPLAATEDMAAYRLSPLEVAQTGARIMHQLALMLTQTAESSQDIVTILQQGWAAQQLEAAPLLRAALILCADHELNVSSFTARCVASAGGTPYNVVTAGLSALQGTKHGGYTERVAALLRELDHAPQVRAAIVSRLKRGEEVPGFGQTLYPQGDPRGRMLLDMTIAALPQAPAVSLAQAVVTEMQQLTGQHPTIDFGLTTLSHALALPSGAALALFALGRTIGWIGHAIEQYQLDRIIRPRARYVGVQPLLG
jgi:citrate synthase